MNADVAIYPVDAGGLSKDNHLAAQNTMNDMAALTGGRAFLNRNDLAIGIKNSLDDGSVYYTLEYYPDNKQWDGQFSAPSRCLPIVQASTAVSRRVLCRGSVRSPKRKQMLGRKL